MDYTTHLQEAIAGLASRAGETRLNRDYYEGNHRTKFQSAAFTNPNREVIEGIRDNQCKNVVELTVARLRIVGIRVEDPTHPLAEETQARAAGIWKRSKMGLRRREWLTGAEITGKPCALIVDPDASNKARIWPHQPEQVWMVMSEENPGLVLWAAKFWTGDDGYRRATIRTLTEVVELVSSDLTSPRPEAGSYQVETITEHTAGQTGVFAADLGMSDLDTAIPMQDMLNKDLQCAALAGEKYALETTVWLGMELEVDPNTGEKVPPFKLGTNRNFFPPPSDGSTQPTDVKQLRGAVPTPFLDAADADRNAVARNTFTPSYLLLQGGQPPAGVTLKTAEAPFVGKVLDRQELYGSQAGDALTYGVRLEIYLETGVWMDVPQVEIVWCSANTPSEEVTAQVVGDYVAAGVPIEQALVRYAGWSEEEAQKVADVNAEKAAEAAAAAAAFGLPTL